jgi:hypothetical protein
MRDNVTYLLVARGGADTGAVLLRSLHVPAVKGAASRLVARP